MEVVVIGGTGLIGSKLVERLRRDGHRAVPASPATGVNAFTGEGLAGALEHADAVVDVTNAPSFEAAAALGFFTTSTANLLAAEADAGVGHHVALSIVGVDRLPDSGYFRAKVAQEELIRGGPVPFTIVHATQFFEFLASIADDATDADTVRIAPVAFQPIAADDVAGELATIVTAAPRGGVVEIAGPERFRFDELIERHLASRHDPRHVIADPDAPYFGARLDELSLVPGDGATLAATRYEDWSAAHD